MRSALILPILLLLPIALAQPQGEPYMIHMQGNLYVFLPDELEVPAGATVYAMNFPAPDPNATNEPHTVTSATDRSLFDVQNIPPTGEPRPFTAPSEPGRYPYYCIYHGDANGAGMAGVLVVTEAASPSPAPSPTPSAPPASTAEAKDSPAPWLALVVVAALLAALARRR